MLLRITLVLVLLGTALLVRFTGLLQSPDPVLPPLAGAATVLPGTLRAGAATETELMHMRDTFGIRGVVAIGAVTVEERAATHALGMKHLTVDFPTDGTPTAAQVVELVRFVRSTTAAHGAVYLHDADGDGPVLVAAAMLQLADRMSLSEVMAGMTPDEQRKLTPAQRQALRDAEAALTAPIAPTGPWTPLREVVRR